MQLNFNNLIQYLVYTKKEDIRLGFFFNHLKNNGYIAILFTIGIYLWKDNKIKIFPTEWMNNGVASIFFIYGTILLILNIVQLMYVLSEYREELKINFLIFVFLSTLNILFMISLTVVLVYFESSLSARCLT